MALEYLIFWGLLSISVLFWAIIPIWRGGALWVPTYNHVVRKMLEMSKVRPGEVVMDLGSGDGRIPIMAAKEFGARGLGVEINFFLVWWARLRARFLGARQTKFIWQDLWSTDVSRIDVITLFLFDKSTPKVGEKLLKEAKEDIRVVSHLWKLGPGWKLIDHDLTNRVWVYQKEKAI